MSRWLPSAYLQFSIAYLRLANVQTTTSLSHIIGVKILYSIKNLRRMFCYCPCYCPLLDPPYKLKKQFSIILEIFQNENATKKIISLALWKKNHYFIRFAFELEIQRYHPIPFHMNLKFMMWLRKQICYTQYIIGISAFKNKC